MVVLLIFMLPMLFLVAVISFSFLFVMLSSSPRIATSNLSAILRDLLFLDTYNLSISSLGCKVLCILISFLIRWSIYWSSFLIYFRNDPEYIKMGKSVVYLFDGISTAEFDFNKISCSSEILLLFFFHVELFDGVRFQYSQILVVFFLPECSNSFQIWQFYPFIYISRITFHY